MKVISNNQHKGLDDVFMRVVFHIATKTSKVYAEFHKPEHLFKFDFMLSNQLISNKSFLVPFSSLGVSMFVFLFNCTN